MFLSWCSLLTCHLHFLGNAAYWHTVYQFLDIATVRTGAILGGCHLSQRLLALVGPELAELQVLTSRKSNNVIWGVWWKKWHVGKLFKMLGPHLILLFLSDKQITKSWIVVAVAASVLIFLVGVDDVIMRISEIWTSEFVSTRSRNAEMVSGLKQMINRT